MIPLDYVGNIDLSANDRSGKEEPLAFQIYNTLNGIPRSQRSIDEELMISQRYPKALCVLNVFGCMTQ